MLGLDKIRITGIQRKEPTQARAKAVVKAILQAATHILLEKGLEETFTTNHIARLAGVSIGSLYQYFPNKEAIVARLTELHVEKETLQLSRVMTEILDDVLSTDSNLISKKNIRLIMKEIIDTYAKNLKLTQILCTHIACRQIFRNTTHFFTNLVQNMLNQEKRFMHEDNYNRAYIITHSVDLLIQTTLVEQPSLLTEPKFLDELVDLIMNYLNPV